MGSAWRARQRADAAAPYRRPRRDGRARPLPASSRADGGARPARRDGVGSGHGQPGAERPARRPPVLRARAGGRGVARAARPRASVGARVLDRQRAAGADLPGARSTSSGLPRRGSGSSTRPVWWRSTAWHATALPTTGTACSGRSTPSAPTSTSAGTAVRFPRDLRPGRATSPPIWTRCTESSPTRPSSSPSSAQRPPAAVPSGEKGTYAFQTRYLREHLRVAARHPHVNGAMVWNLRDFRVYPGWNGGNPRPRPPYNSKGLIGTDGKAKPAYFEVRRMFRRNTIP